MRALALLLACSTMIACSDRGGTKAPAPPAIDATAATPLRDPHRWDCASDGDCVNSCRWGAVNAAWYRTSSQRPDFQECDDGCANQISEAPRCEAGACVAYHSDPQDSSKVTRAVGCTRVEPR